MTRVLALAALVSASLVPAYAASEATYDGSWLVNVVARQATCASSKFKVELGAGRITRLRIEVAINGKMTEFDNSFVKTAGGIDPAGRVSVTLTQGPEVMSVTGRLSGRAGGGSWASQSGACSGAWHASRA